MQKFNVKEKAKEIRSDPVVLEWVDGLEKITEQGYIRYLAEFCIINTTNPEKLLETAKYEAANPQTVVIPSLKKWFSNYEKHNIELNRANSTYHQRSMVIKSFFNYYEIDVPRERRNKRRKKKQQFFKGNKREALTKKDIRKALDACWKVRVKAMILTQCSSGLSVADVLKLTIKDFENGLVDIGENREICRFHFKVGRQKGSLEEEREFYTFISFEAVEAIKDYLKTERHPKHENPYIFSHSKIFEDRPLTPHNVQDDLRKLNHRLRVTNLEYGRFNPITSHMFRKWFNTRLANTEMSYEARKTLMGHVVPGVDDNYYLTHSDDLMKLYIKYMPVLLIQDYESVNITTVDEEVEKLKQKLAEKDEVEKMKNEENRILKEKVELIESVLIKEKIIKDKK